MRPLGVRSLAREQRGQVSAFVVVLATACLLFAGLVLDGGLALAAKTRALGQAQGAARAGAQELDLRAYRTTVEFRLNPTHAHASAHRYLTTVGATGTVHITGNTVTVSVSTGVPTQLLGLVGINDITVTGSGQAEPQQTPGPIP